MTLPVKQEGSAEQLLGTTSLEMVRSRIIRNIHDSPGMTWRQRRRVIRELDSLIEGEKHRRARLAAYQSQKEELEHKLAVAQKQAEIYEKYADVVTKLRLFKAQTDRAVARHVNNNLMDRIDVIERLMRIKVKYKPVQMQDNYHEELFKIKRQQKLSEARERAILDSIAKKTMSRAAFIKMVNEQFPDLADDLITFYDQQLFHWGTRR